MITVRTMGGLGNQLFQYAFGVAQACRLCTKLQIDSTSNKLESSRPFNLNLFQIPEPVVQGSQGRVLREQRAGYDPTVESTIKDGDLLVGYWQSEKYFESVERTVRRRFFPRESWTMDRVASYFADKIYEAEKGSVSLGVRRTDYVKDPRTQAFHGNVDLDYYKEALKIVRSKIGVDPVIFVFSDDIDWVKNNWDFGYKTYFWDQSDMTVQNHIGREDIDLGLMAECNSAIIPNSSFAWWGAWMGDCLREGVVVAPNQWFADETAQSQISETICPDRWLRV